MTIGMIVATAIASWFPFTLAERAERSDAIAIVMVTDIFRMTNGVYRSVAVAHVEQSLKGVEGVDSIQLLFDAEPNVSGRDVRYAKGEHCLLFLSEVSPGKYDLIQSVFAKHLIKDGEIEDTDGHHGMQKVALTNIVKQVKALLSEKQLTRPIIGEGKIDGTKIDFHDINRDGKIKVMGRFGLPIGQIITLEGKRAENSKISNEQTLVVEKVNGIQVEAPEKSTWKSWIQIRNVEFLPKEGSIIVKGYEFLDWVGDPLINWHIEVDFVITEVVAPTNLKTKSWRGNNPVLYPKTTGPDARTDSR